MHRIKNVTGTLLMIILVIVMKGCYYDKEELLYPVSNVNCSSVNASFTNVKTIIVANCATAGCHNAASGAGGTIFETYDQVKAKAARINQRTIIERSMPPGGSLSPNEIAILKCWINSGTPNN